MIRKKKECYNFPCFEKTGTNFFYIFASLQSEGNIFVFSNIIRYSTIYKDIFDSCIKNIKKILKIKTRYKKIIEKKNKKYPSISLQDAKVAASLKKKRWRKGNKKRRKNIFYLKVYKNDSWWRVINLGILVQHFQCH